MIRLRQRKRAEQIRAVLVRVRHRRRLVERSAQVVRGPRRRALRERLAGLAGQHHAHHSIGSRLIGGGRRSRARFVFVGAFRRHRDVRRDAGCVAALRRREVDAVSPPLPRGDEVPHVLVAPQLLQRERVQQAEQVHDPRDEGVRPVGRRARAEPAPGVGFLFVAPGDAVERLQHERRVRPLGLHLLHRSARLHEARQRVVRAEHHQEADDERVHLERVRVPERVHDRPLPVVRELQERRDADAEHGERDRAGEGAAEPPERQGQAPVPLRVVDHRDAPIRPGGGVVERAEGVCRSATTTGRF